jgi:hypothetical protein
VEKWLPETHLLVSIREAKRLLRATIAIAIIAPRAQARCTMPQVGLVFDHAEYGQCSVLGTIQWIDQRGCQHRWCYYRIANRTVDDATLKDSEKWDSAPNAIKRELVSCVTERISAQTVSALYPRTSLEAAGSMTRHPLLHDLSNFAEDPFYKRVAESNPAWGAAAADAAAKMASAEVARAGQIKVLMQEQVAFVGLLAGCVNDKLERTRRVRIDAHSDGVPPEKKTTDRIFLSPMQSKMLETVLLLAGFFEEEDGLWASVDDEAIKRFLGPSAHVERANLLRKIWYYTRLELAQGRRGRSKVVFTLFDPQAASEKVRATRTRGASAILTLC